MSTALTHFPPNRTEALARLSAFVPRAGREYAARRNYDLGPGQHKGVSTLSPYIRTRLITETEVLQAVLGRHSLQAAEKYVQEVYWRTYWKGWLELRPAVWTQYQTDLNRHLNAVQTQSGLRDRWEAACKGETEIACFNAWAHELVTTGYMHNHARMWFASIWIFTLQLPWELGADFFLRHLLDGDAASNTLSWRWVAGLQTQGKTYLARTSNISKFTEGRFAPKWQLAGQAPPLPFTAPPVPRVLPDDPPPVAGKRTGLILHAEDMSPGFVIEGRAITATLFLDASDWLSPLQIAPHVRAFHDGCLADVQSRWGDKIGTAIPTVHKAQEIVDWAKKHGLEQIVTAYAPVGPAASLLETVSRTGPALHRIRRAQDGNAWIHATKGFSPFKAKIPHLLAAEGLVA